MPTAYNGREGNTESNAKELVAVWPRGVRDPEHAMIENPAMAGSGKVCGLKPDMYTVEKSDIGIVPEKEPNNKWKNKGVQPPRQWTKGRHICQQS